MKKKLLIIGVVLLVLGLGTVLVVLNMDWGERLSKIEKTEVEEAVDSTDEKGNIKPSLDDLLGLYKVDTKTGKAELLFDIDGLKTTKGAFEKFNVGFDVKEDFTKSELSVIIDAASINTENSMRDEHLVSEDYFKTEQYPEITFESNKMSFVDTAYTAIGDLSLIGSTNELTIYFDHIGGKDLRSGKRIEVFEGDFQFDRTKYGMEEESGMGNIVRITFYIELEKQ